MSLLLLPEAEEADWWIWRSLDKAGVAASATFLTIQQAEVSASTPLSLWPASIVTDR
ncbi:hypothetical protein KCP75_21770 [Salmonella enterica subsp. enterica]|nr:hypothetical protein KCP75_21770 [Salmonella enterica subsp. enterica]